MPKIARPLPAPPEHEVVTPDQPIPVMMTMVHNGEGWGLPAVAEARTASQLVRIHWIHPRTRQTYTHWGTQYGHPKDGRPPGTGRSGGEG